MEETVNGGVGDLTRVDKRAVDYFAVFHSSREYFTLSDKLALALKPCNIRKVTSSFSATLTNSGVQPLSLPQKKTKTKHEIAFPLCESFKKN